MIDLVTYNQAKELLDIGFNDPCFAKSEHYKKCPNKVNGDCALHNLHCQYPDCEIDKTIKSIKLPTYSQAFRFFRDKYNIAHRINRAYDGDEESFYYQYDILGVGYNEINCNHFESYEVAESTCLDGIIELVKIYKNKK